MARKLRGVSRDVLRLSKKVTLCDICFKDSKKYKQGCAVLKYKIGQHNDSCFAFTDDPSWEKKVNTAVMAYAISKGQPDYVPLGQEE